MNQPGKASQLIARVKQRMVFSTFASRFQFALIIAAILYAILLLTSRFTGWYMEYMTLWSLLAIPAAALLGALAFHRSPTEKDAAMQIDKTVGAKDLFLTVTMLEGTPGSYQPIVQHQAEKHAADIQPTNIIKFNWQRGAARVLLTTSVIICGMLFLPQLDPFGKVEAKENTKKEKEQLASTRKSNTLRKKQLEKLFDNKDQRPVKMAMDELKKSFNKMQPKQIPQNKAVLQKNRQQISDLYKKQLDQGKEVLKSKSMSQQFGQLMDPEMKQWKQDLANGNTDAIQKKLEEMKKLAEKLKDEKDPEKRKELEQKLKKGLQGMSNFAQNNLNNPQLQQALNSALQQLQASKGQNGQPNSNQQQNQLLNDLAESLDLSQLELKDLAQSLKDMQDLKDALQALQDAQKLNQDGKLSGGECKDCKNISEYAEHFKKMCQGNGSKPGDQPGSGTGNPGFGGGTPPEDGSGKTAYKPEKDPTRLSAGKMLSLKVRGVSEKGENKTDYAQTIQDLKNAAGEAIIKEQIPPGPRDLIQKYFDNIEKVNPSPDAKK